MMVLLRVCAWAIGISLPVAVGANVCPTTSPHGGLEALLFHAFLGVIVALCILFTLVALVFMAASMDYLVLKMCEGYLKGGAR